VKSKLLLITGILALLVAAGGFVIYWKVFSEPSVSPSEGDGVEILIPGNATWEQVADTLGSKLEIVNMDLLEWVARKKNYPRMIKAGRYVIEEKISYNTLINRLRSGRQDPVRLTFNNIRSVAELAGKAGEVLEADSAEIADFLSDPSNYSSDGFTEATIISAFIPDTYEFFWNTGAEGFYSRMLREYRNFWDKGRTEKAEIIGLSQTEVATLASIVDAEAARNEEKPRIAGVYLNRLRTGIPLQADPTVRFAMNDYTITRVLKKHLLVDSPYNTYKYRGLPPGPIACPSVDGIDAVLNAEKHDYIFFAAKADFSGYHNFSRTLREHNRYAAEYQRELNRRKIFR